MGAVLEAGFQTMNTAIFRGRKVIKRAKIIKTFLCDVKETPGSVIIRNNRSV